MLDFNSSTSQKSLLISIEYQKSLIKLYCGPL